MPHVNQRNAFALELALPDIEKSLTDSLPTLLVTLLTPKYSLILWLSGLTILHLPWPPGESEFVASYGKFIAPLTVLAFFSWLVEMLWYGMILPRWNSHLRFRNAHRCLNGPLSGGERAFLLAALQDDKQSHQLDDEDEEVKRLVGRDVLAPLPGEDNYQFDNAVWSYLQRHKDAFVNRWKPAKPSRR